jgi:prepilin-type processing-associated H-X9-DG protein
MKLRPSNRNESALTLLELCVLLGLMAVVVVFLMSSLAGAANEARTVDCVNNLKRIGVAYDAWAIDHIDEYPLKASITSNGVSQLLRKDIPTARLLYWNYLTMSNQLATPKLLHCPADQFRPMAETFASGFSDANISYFAGMDADQSLPQSILSGDDNLLLNGKAVNSALLQIPANAEVAWTKKRHNRSGTISYADGSVQHVTNEGLKQALQRTAQSTNRFLVP